MIVAVENSRSTSINILIKDSISIRFGPISYINFKRLWKSNEKLNSVHGEVVTWSRKLKMKGGKPSSCCTAYKNNKSKNKTCSGSRTRDLSVSVPEKQVSARISFIFADQLFCKNRSFLFAFAFGQAIATKIHFLFLLSHRAYSIHYCNDRQTSTWHSIDIRCWKKLKYIKKLYLTNTKIVFSATTFHAISKKQKKL